MNYIETMQYFSDFPPFSPAKVVSGEEALNLNSIVELLRRLGNPERKLHYVHITGTNGKGSTATYLRNILTASGYKTGQFSSPYLVRFSEQITVDGVEISQEALAELTSQVKVIADQMAEEGLQAPSAFEVTCAVAFLYYVQKACDIVVLEVGLGGRTDATNVIPAPLLAMITSISLDHTELLGDTLEKIAGEKGGIIKPGCEVLLYPQTEEVTHTIKEICQKERVPLRVAPTAHPVKYMSERAANEAVMADCRDKTDANKDINLDSNTNTGTGTDTDNDSVVSAGNLIRMLPYMQQFMLADDKERVYHTQMLASYQCQNAAMAITAAHMLRENEFFRITDETIATGIAQAKWPARFEIMHRDLTIIVDGSHNVEGAQMLRDNLMRFFADRKITFIVGVLADKSYEAMLRNVLPIADRFYTVTPHSERALPAEDLAGFLRGEGASAEAVKDVKTALIHAVNDKESQKGSNSDVDSNCICIFGSLYYAGEAREIVLSQIEEL